MASRRESGGRLTWRALPGDGRDRHPGLAVGRSCPAPARVVVPAAAIERRAGGRRAGVEVFGEGLRPVIVFHEGLRSVGMVHDGSRPVVHDVMAAADSRAGKA